MTRGIKTDVDRFINDLQGKYLPFTINSEADAKALNIKGGKGTYQVQVAVRPIQLWEIVYPEEHNDLMLTTIFGNKQGAKGVTHQKKHRPFVAMIRKWLGVKKLPDYDDKAALPIYKANTEFVGIGVKEDYKLEDGTQAL